MKANEKTELVNVVLATRDFCGDENAAFLEACRELRINPERVRFEVMIAAENEWNAIYRAWDAAAEDLIARHYPEVYCNEYTYPSGEVIPGTIVQVIGKSARVEWADQTEGWEDLSQLNPV